MSTVMLHKILKAIRITCRTNITITPQAAKRFFKTTKGSYGAGDIFLGITTPNLRKIIKIYKDIDLAIIQALLQSKYHEERLLALLTLVQQYQKGSGDRQQDLCAFYLNNLNYVNNWDLVDSSAHHILGHYLYDKTKSMLIKLAMSNILWERRIAIVATLYFIRKSQIEWTFKIAKLLLNDPHDLIHKAVGWMLREAGKKDKARLIAFLSKYSQKMPKIMLRYAIERLSDAEKVKIKLCLC